MNDTDRIVYWSRMLNEAMDDKTLPALDERRMSGPASGHDEIAEFRQKLENGVVEFEFMKADGSRRHAIGTTSEQIVPTAERLRLDPSYDENLASYERRAAYIIWFWDLEKNSCRCFNTNRFEGIVHYEQTSRHIDTHIDRIGEIFIHRDIDDDTVASSQTQPSIEQINAEILHMAVNGEMSNIFGSNISVNSDVSNITVERGNDNQPVLRIIIQKNGTDHDQPYQLKINELREIIRTRFNTEIRKVIVDGEFNY